MEQAPVGGQGARILSFAGGVPRMPAGLELPTCSLCSAPQTFFFQVAFPDGVAWSGRTMAVFACTACADDEHLIPEMLSVPLRGAEIPAGFLERYQVNFRFVVFPTEDGELRREYEERIVFQPWSLRSTEPSAAEHKVGGDPAWLLEDERPARYSGAEMIFLMQLMPEMTFPIHASAPPQTRVGLSGKSEPSPHRYYELFIGNAVYWFGTEAGSAPAVYALTQID